MVLEAKALYGACALLAGLPSKLSTATAHLVGSNVFFKGGLSRCHHLCCDRLCGGARCCSSALSHGLELDGRVSQVDRCGPTARDKRTETYKPHACEP